MCQAVRCAAGKLPQTLICGAAQPAHAAGPEPGRCVSSPDKCAKSCDLGPSCSCPTCCSGQARSGRLARDIYPGMDRSGSVEHRGLPLVCYRHTRPIGSRSTSLPQKLRRLPRGARIWGRARGEGPADFTNAKRMLAGARDLYTAKIRRGAMGTGMSYWGSMLAEEELSALVDYLWTFSLGTQE